MTATLTLVRDVPVVVERPPKAGTWDRYWPWLMAAAAFATYLAVGWHLVHGVGFEIGDAISRTGAAHHVVASRDPHLGAMGFYWMPLPTLSQIPAVLLLGPFGHAQFAGPATTALWGALTIPVLAAIGRNNLAPAWLNATLCAVYAASPIALWVGANGMSESSSFFFMAVTMLGYTGWWRWRRTSSLVVTSVGLAGIMLCRYEAILVTAAVAVMCAVVLPRARWVRTIALVAAPAAYVFLLWLFASRLIVGDPFYWFKELSRIAEISGTGALFYKAEPRSLRAIGQFTLAFVAFFSLLLLALVPLVPRRDLKASLGRLGLLVPGLVFPVNLAGQLARGGAPGAARYFYPCWIAAVCAALALAGDRIGGPRRTRALRGGLATVAAVSAVVQLFAFANPRVSNVENEGVLFAPVVGRDAPTPPDPAGWSAPYDPWKALFADADPLLRDGFRLLLDTDSAPHATLFSRYPRRLIIPEDRDYEQILAAPDGRVDLVAVPETAGQRGSRYVAAIRGVVTARSSDGTWEKIGTYGELSLYRFVKA